MDIGPKLYASLETNNWHRTRPAQNSAASSARHIPLAVPLAVSDRAALVACRNASLRLNDRIFGTCPIGFVSQTGSARFRLEPNANGNHYGKSGTTFWLISFIFC